MLSQVRRAIGHAFYDEGDNGYGRAANILTDIVRASGLFNLLGGGAANFTPEACPIQMTEGVVYRGGAFTDQNFTPRPNDTTGLSTFDSLESAAQPGGKAQIIDVGKLDNLKAIPDAPPPGHVSITPGSQTLLEEWMATRGTSTVHPLTEELKAARIGEIRRPK